MPVPASLSAISHVEVAVWEAIIDEMCHLSASSPPMLLRPPAQGAVASGGAAAAAVPVARAGGAAAVSAAALTEEVSGGPDGSALLGELRPALSWGLASAIM
jgi:hypothetical protein